MPLIRTLYLAVFALLAPLTTSAQLHVEWRTDYSLGNVTQIQAIQTDSSGASWVSGLTVSGSARVFLSRISAAGVVVQSDVQPQPGLMNRGLALLSGGIYSGGYFEGYGALLRYDLSGQYQETQYFLLGPINTQIIGLAANGSTFFSAGNSTELNGSSYAFLNRHSSTGAIVWTRYVGPGFPEAYGSGVTVDSLGNSIVVGYRNRLPSEQQNQAFAVKYDPDGGLVWAETLVEGVAKAATTDGSGNVYVAGLAATGIAFLTKRTPSGGLVWVRGYQPQPVISTIGYGLAVDNAGRVCMCGVTGNQGFVARFTGDGDFIDEFLFEGGTSVNGLTVGADNAIYVAGFSQNVALVAKLSSANRAPVAVDDLLSTTRNTVLSFPVSALLDNDSDPDNQTLTLQSVASTTIQGGQLRQSGGMLAYTPPIGFSGQDAFAYSISDGNGGTASATVRVNVNGTGATATNLLSLSFEPGARIRWQAIVGQSYTIEFTDQLTNNWQALTNVTADGTGVVDFTDTSALPPHRFYRLVGP